MNDTIRFPNDRGARPRLGFLGLGWIGRHRMEAVMASGLAEVKALCDPSPDMIDAAAAAAPDAVVAPTFEDLLGLDLDGVVIATPSALHAAQSIQALERGLAVFCQKPLGLNAEETAAVVRAARKADRLLGVDLSYRHTAAMRCIRDRLRQGAIGEVFAADLTFHNAYGPDKPWFYDARLSGGGCVTDLGVHLVDLFLWTLEFPRVSEAHARLFAGGKRLDPRSGIVEDYAAATLETDTGAIARIACSWRLNAGCDADISAIFYGDQGALALANVDGSFYDFTAEIRKGTGKEVLVTPPDAWGGRAAVAWAEQLSQGEGFDASAETYVHTARALDLIYGRKVGDTALGEGPTPASRTETVTQFKKASRRG